MDMDDGFSHAFSVFLHDLLVWRRGRKRGDMGGKETRGVYPAGSTGRVSRFYNASRRTLLLQ